MPNITHKISRFTFWLIFLATHFLMVSLLAWHLMAQVDFAYPLGYKMLNLQKHIQENAPNNRFKHEFELTTPQEQWEIFSQITDAVQHHGKGLAEISYKLPNGSSIPLMHQAEIIHLQDVANLIDKVYTIGAICAFIWIILMVVAIRKKMSFPPLQKILIGFVSVILSASILIISFGAKDIFYWLHTKIFPNGHQWFFYYEDSLMTTLMKAPDIFAFIALLLITLLAIFWTTSVWGINKVLVKNHNGEINKIKSNSAKTKQGK